MTETPIHDRVSATPFPEASGRSKGYEKRAVDAFLAQAREAFEADAEGALRSSEIRAAAFPLVRGGYAVAAVDAALGRVEDAFAAREREFALSRLGARAWVAETRDTAQVVLDRLGRPRGERFDRVGLLRYGYRVDEVDVVADRVAGYLAAGHPVTPEQVRAVAFRMQRGGYREAQVDAVLDAVVEVMLAVG
ncbi:MULTISPECIES: DivIVA domain-containing protein [unclassified Microbacterium]|uniref:DivIVA domain-containing protein n=1 Tax=unclassified Microbacterium TaxID=2609290 RepID=UPI0006FD29C0|nr:MULTISPECIES: DivIVA domain-containing protein [unclassified Microbacterium]KQT72760.1 MFS transporter permease [Microbacterium sp. Leaf436]MBD8205042.1 DivIVA domain-containing protein [Microbacterium sp. CFBP 8801]MBD8218395.1 DivIVA domain-containing protein [Microbacterium sp. CFBP 13617]MBD8477758.1 DivIVA domain-containing protein [Microbacterium sp. CFBP 8794]MBD8509903.1 DivIVA domain-containing protein [Microbacterium sp. CFBP 8790]